MLFLLNLEHFPKGRCIYICVCPIFPESFMNSASFPHLICNATSIIKFLCACRSGSAFCIEFPNVPIVLNSAA